MSSRRLHLLPEEFAAAEVRLSGARAQRLAKVLRLRAGAKLLVFDGLGGERRASVLRAGRATATLQLGAVVESLAEPPVPVTLACAFPRGARGDWIVEKTTELGVAGILPLTAARSVIEPGAGRLTRWRRVAIEAAEQCGRAVVPEIGGVAPPGAAALVADLVAGSSGGVTVREALARPTEKTAQTAGTAQTARPAGTAQAAVVLYVGPEGGWSDEERLSHAAAGRVSVTLGPRTLRVETAAVLGVAQALEATGGLGQAAVERPAG